MEIKDAQNIVMDGSGATVAYLCDEPIWPEETGVTKVYLECDKPTTYERYRCRIKDADDNYLKLKRQTVYAKTYNGIGEKLYISGETKAGLVKFAGANTPMVISEFSNVFSNESGLTEVNFSNLTFDPSASFSLDYFFQNTPNLTKIVWPSDIKETPIRVTSAVLPFENCGISEIDLDYFDFSECTSFERFFDNYYPLYKYPKKLNFKNMDTSKGQVFSQMFKSNSNFVAEEKENIEKMKVTSAATKLNGMFDSVYKLNLDLSGWDVSNVTNFAAIFRGQSFSATESSLNIDTWDTSNATDMTSMFYDRNLTGYDYDFTNLKTGKVTTMEYMFGGIGNYRKKPSIDLSGWDVSNVTNFGYMFKNTNLSSLDLSGWHITMTKDNINYYSNMFEDAYIDRLILKDSDNATLNYIEDMLQTSENATILAIET